MIMVAALLGQRYKRRSFLGGVIKSLCCFCRVLQSTQRRAAWSPLRNKCSSFCHLFCFSVLPQTTMVSKTRILFCKRTSSITLSVATLKIAALFFWTTTDYSIPHFVTRFFHKGENWVNFVRLNHQGQHLFLLLAQIFRSTHVFRTGGLYLKTVIIIKCNVIPCWPTGR